MKRSKVALAAVIVSAVVICLSILGVIFNLANIEETAKIAGVSAEELRAGLIIIYATGIPLQILAFIFGLLGYLKNKVGFIIAALVLSILAILTSSIYGLAVIVLYVVSISKVKQCKLDEEMRNYEDDGTTF